ncbi:hypothetical protein GCM10023183_18960 [Nibribacter koreensis]|uniref:Uncharacterized protein n=2 Tax=Nibribacter koreensis TaxID=1084519 RepID=A0ABP8FJ88_9BACT
MILGSSAEKGGTARNVAEAKKSSNVIKLQQPTLHKIWAFKEIKPVKNGVSTMFNVPKITMMDFRERDSLKYEINDSIQAIHYEVENNRIKFRQEGILIPVSYRIEKLTKKTLELILVIDYAKGDDKKQGDLVKLIFNQMEK